MSNNIDKKNTPFKVPENYFQNFNTEIMAKLPEKEKAKKVVPLWRSFTKWTAIAAAVTGIAIVGLHQLNKNSDVVIDNTQTEMMSNNEQLASIQNDYYLFLEDEATQMIYEDSFYTDQL